MPTRRRMPQNTILISRHASPSSNRISRSPARFVGAAPQRDYRKLFYSPSGIFLAFSFQQSLATRPRRFHLEIIRCLETQSAGRGHHQTSAHTQEDTGGEHRPDFKAHRRRYSAEGLQYGAIARYASLKSANQTHAPQFQAPPLCGALLLVQVEWSGSLATTFLGASNQHQ